MSSMERPPHSFHLRESITRGFAAVLSYQAITVRTVPRGASEVTSSSKFSRRYPGRG